MKKTVVILVLVGLAGFAAWYFYFRNKRPKGKEQVKQANKPAADLWSVNKGAVQVETGNIA